MRQSDEGKVDQLSANYRESDGPGHSCRDCVHYLDPGQCEVVGGEISPGGVSDLFEPLMPEEGMAPPGGGMMGPMPAGPMPAGPMGGMPA